MKAIGTTDGFVYWGTDDEEIVTKMRRAAFFDRHTSNRAFIKAIAERLSDTIGKEAARRLGRSDAADFLTQLSEVGLVSDVTARFTCPILNQFCEYKDEKCGSGGCKFKITH